MMHFHYFIIASLKLHRMDVFLIIRKKQKIIDK